MIYEIVMRCRVSRVRVLSSRVLYAFLVLSSALPVWGGS